MTATVVEEEGERHLACLLASLTEWGHGPRDLWWTAFRFRQFRSVGLGIGESERLATNWMAAREGK